jgi:hypothetical protein
MNRQLPERILGGGGDYLSLSHWVLDGTNREIGRALGAFARESLGTGPMPCPDESLIRAQRRFLAASYPSLLDRMAGVADAFGTSLDNAAVDLSTLWFDVDFGGCSAAFVPASRGADGHARVLRNLDLGVDLNPGPRPAPCARLFAIEMRPDSGYSSLSMVAFDLLAAMDGINSEGLVVVCNTHADWQLDPAYRREPCTHPEPGLNEMQVVRYLLDQCADAAEAKEAFLSIRRYYCFVPCLYLVADRHGRAFVCEMSASGNRTLFSEVDGEPQLMTNFGLARFPDRNAVPQEGSPEKGSVYTRYRILRDRLDGAVDPVSEAALKELALAASLDCISPPRQPNDTKPGRTIWTAIYDIENRSMSISAYLGETDGGTHRADYITLPLGQARP